MPCEQASASLSLASTQLALSPQDFATRAPERPATTAGSASMRRNAAVAACQVPSTDAVAALAIWSRDAARTSARSGVPMDAGSSSPSGGGIATSLHALTAVGELPDLLPTIGRLAMRDVGPVPSGTGLDLLRPPR